jgi:hypothetical protein
MKKVIVTAYHLRQRQDGGEFVALDLTGSLEIIVSEKTGKMYATTRKVSMPSTLDVSVAAMMVGTQLDGEIVRVPCDPYEYKTKTGDVLNLAYRYAYQPPGSKETIGYGSVDIEQPAPVRNTANSNGLRAAAARRMKEL